MMRITGGTLKGRVLKHAVPDGIRPTAARTREALFSIIGQDLHGWSMIDLFGGTGLVAMEAASRGAFPVLIVEKNPRFAKMIRETLRELGLSLSVREGDALRLSLPPADLVFADPPYDLSPDLWLEKAAALSNRLLVAEARAGAKWPEKLGKLTLDRVRNYGEGELGIYRVPDSVGTEP